MLCFENIKILLLNQFAEGLGVLGKAGTLESSKAGKRWHIVHTHKAHPNWSFTKIGKVVGAYHSTVSHWIAVHERTGDVKDQPRSGRKPVIDKSALSKLRSAATKKHSLVKFSASRLSRALQAQGGASASARSVRRHLRDAGWQYGYAKRVHMLTASHKAKRLSWAKRHLSKKTPFSSWMFTDSKLFLLHRAAGKCDVKVWWPEDCRPMSTVARRSQGVHVYLGATKYGLTVPIFVTGGGSQKSEHIDPKTGKPHAGVGAAEYQKDVIPKLLRSGEILFAANSRWGAEWIFQQDNARPHSAASTQALLQRLMPNRVERQWPAMSPDLSWIENMWAWAERQLATNHSDIQTIPQLKSAIIDIFKHVPLHMLQNHVRGMHERLVKVVQQDGGHIG